MRKTANGLGMHALNLDGNVGPWMQVVKLRGIMEYASKKGLHHLTGGQLELMNLAGPGSGLEMLQPPGRDMPTSNFFERGGYERNPVVHEKTGAQLLVRLDEIMDRNVQKAGAQQFAKIFDGVARRLAAGGQVQNICGGRPALLQPFRLPQSFWLRQVSSVSAKYLISPQKVRDPDWVKINSAVLNSQCGV